MRFFALPSLVGLLIQAAGSLLISALCFVLLRTIRLRPLFYWSIGWLMLFGALSTLWIGFQLSLSSPICQPLYLFGEYAFGYLVFAGCRHYATGAEVERREIWLLPIGAALALGLPWLGGGDFNVFFAIHTVVYAYLFFSAWRAIRRAKPNERTFAGLRVMKIALLLLTVDYLHYAPLFAMSSLGQLPGTLPYLEYAPLYDLILLFMLAFGMVMVMTGEVQRELEAANAELGRAHDRLHSVAEIDHLTSALNRHALYSLIGDERDERRAVLSGTAVVADIDNLKTINDRHGHQAGDAAIRAVVTAIRACIRADDLLFRWGGDEFLILLLGVSEDDARARLATVNERLKAHPIEVSITVGIAAFDSATSLDQVIAVADEAMYGRKRAPDPS